MYVSTSYVTLDVCTLLPCYSLDIRIIRYWLSVLLFVVILLFFRELLLSIFLSIFEIVQCLFWILSARINCLILKKFLKKLLRFPVVGTLCQELPLFIFLWCWDPFPIMSLSWGVQEVELVQSHWWRALRLNDTPLWIYLVFTACL